MSKDNLDNFFQQKANERSFEFEDDYWKEMELLLEDESDKKTPVPFWWQNGRLLLGSLMAIVAIGALYMVLTPNSNQANPVSQETSIQNKNSSDANNKNENIATLNTDNSNVSSEGIESINSINTENTSTDNTTNTIDNNSSNTNNQNNRSNDDLNTNNQNRSTVTSNQRNSSDRNNRPNKNSNNTNSKSVTTQNTTDNNSNKTPANNTNSNPSGELSDTGSGTNEESSTTKKPIATTLNRDAEKTLSEEATFNFLDLIDLSEVDHTLSALKTKLPKPSKEKKIDPPLPENFITIGLHIGASRYFYDTEFQNEQPYSPTAGVYANFPLSKNLSLSTGLNYWARGNINASASGDSTIFNFGFQQITTTDFVSRATYLEVPLSLKYRIREKHMAEIGGSFSYLLTASGSKSVKISDDFGTNDLSYNVTDGYRNWLSSYDAALRVGYHYQWNKRGTIGLQWQYGLTDVTPDDIYNNIIFDRNHQFRVRLAYDLIRISTNKK